MTTAQEKAASARGVLHRGESLLDPTRVRQLGQFIIDAQVGQRQDYTETQREEVFRAQPEQQSNHETIADS